MQSWRRGMALIGLLAAVAAPVAAQGSHGAGIPPMMMGGDTPSPHTAALQKKADQLVAQVKKQPSSKLKLQAAEAEYQYGHARMYDNALSPRQKYRPALVAFREALKLNPNHKQAKADKDMIENIYRQMGRPIPQ